MTPRRPAAGPGPTFDRDLTDWGLAAFAVFLACGGVLWLGAMAAALVTGHRAPAGGLASALIALAHPLEPARAWGEPSVMPGPIAYWGITALVVLAVIGILMLGLRLRGQFAGSGATRRLSSLPGMATAPEADAAAGRRVLLGRAPVVRPSLEVSARGQVEPEHIGYRLGRIHSRELWCSVEDSVLLVGPPRMGKGLHVVIPWVLDAPGPVIATSTRPDTLAVTLHARSRRGPVAIFDPQRLADLPEGLRWSPVRGCEVPRTALVRARGLAAGAGWSRGVSDPQFWAGQTESTLRCLLHAAALDGRRALDLYRWSLSPALTEDAITILNRHSDAAPGWADALDSVVHSDPRTRDSVWMGVRQSLAALADPAVLAAVDPDPGESFDPVAFLQDSGTLFLLAAAVTSAGCGPLVAAFIEDITETARRLAARSAGARLDPPLLLALDEIANLTPLPSLPSLMAEGGGTGITTLTVLQSLAQARDRWGQHAADTMWDAATVKIVLGGLSNFRDLEDVSRLLGDIDEATQTLSRGRAGERSSSTSMRRMPVMPPSTLRTLPFGSAVLLLRQALPVVLDLRGWTERSDADQLTTGRGAVEAATAGTAPLTLDRVAPAHGARS